MVNEELCKSLAAKAAEKWFQENGGDIKSYYEGYRDALIHFAVCNKFEELILLKAPPHVRPRAPQKELGKIQILPDEGK
jgi:hypothetical protein